MNPNTYITMQSKHLLGVALAMAACAGAATAGTKPACVVAPKPCNQVVECPLSMKLETGYATNYTYRGIVASHSILEGDSVIPSSIDFGYKVNEKNSVVGGIGYTAITSGHKPFGFDGVPEIQNEATANLAWQNVSANSKLTTTAGWGITHGGFSGMYAKLGQGKAHSVTQEFFVDFKYDICEKFFAGLTTSYSFQGMTGWWFQPYVGYKTAICPRVDLEVTAGMSATAGYFGDNQINANGAQAWFIKLTAPVKMNQNGNWKLNPFVSFNWAGSGALKALRGMPQEWKAYKNFGVVAGASVSYEF